MNSFKYEFSTDSLCWKSEQNNVLKMLACSSLPVSSTPELKHWIETIAQTHFTRYTKYKFIAHSQIDKKRKIQNLKGWWNLEKYAYCLSTIQKIMENLTCLL